MENEEKNKVLELPKIIEAKEKELLNAIQLYDALNEKIREVKKQTEALVEFDSAKEEFKSALSNATKRAFEVDKRLKENAGYQELLNVQKSDSEKIEMIRIEKDTLRRTLKAYDIVTRGI